MAFVVRMANGMKCRDYMQPHAAKLIYQVQTRSLFCIYYIIHRTGCSNVENGRKEGNVLFNDALDTFSYGYMASDIW